jgi:hypothetical protein
MNRTNDIIEKETTSFSLDLFEKLCFRLSNIHLLNFDDELTYEFRINLNEELNNLMDE